MYSCIVGPSIYIWEYQTQEKILNFLVVKIVQNFLYTFLYNSYTFPEVLKD